MKPVCVYHGEQLASYGFGHGHPFGPDRHDVFWDEFMERGLDDLVDLPAPVLARREEIELFHRRAYVDRVESQSKTGQGYLDYGDTPAFPGVYEAAAHVVGTTLDAVERLMAGAHTRAFTPIAGLHHARRDGAAGFCVFNDCGVAIEALRHRHGVHRIAYVDIDAHHGDGVYYAFAEDPELFIADIHEDGRFLYPGTGDASESGIGPAKGTKLNIPMRPEADDDDFMSAWQRVEAFLQIARPDFVLLQCGADSLAGDPLTHLRYTAAAHAHAARRLCAIADQYAEGRLLAMGGGGYDRPNLADAWCRVVAAMVEAS